METAELRIEHGYAGSLTITINAPSREEADLAMGAIRRRISTQVFTQQEIMDYKRVTIEALKQMGADVWYTSDVILNRTSHRVDAEFHDMPDIPVIRAIAIGGSTITATNGAIDVHDPVSGIRHTMECEAAIILADILKHMAQDMIARRQYIAEITSEPGDDDSEG